MSQQINVVEKGRFVTHVDKTGYLRECYNSHHNRCTNKKNICACKCHLEKKSEEETSLDKLIRCRPRGKYNVDEKANSHYWMIKLLERKPATLETISYYIKKDKRTTRQLITLLRRKGYHITLKGYGGMYELIKEKCPTCKKPINTSNGLRIHHRLLHGVRI